MFDSLNETLDAHPKETLRQIEIAFPGDNLGGNLSWDVVGQFCGTQAYCSYVDGATVLARDWSALGVEIYRRLKSLTRSCENELSEMRLRCNAIIFCGVDRSISLLDPSVIEDWFFSKIPFPIEEVRGQLEVDDTGGVNFEIFRALKERICIIEELVKKGAFLSNSELSDWTSLHNSLP